MHFFVFKNNKGLIGWRIDKEAIPALGEDLTQAARGFYAVFAEAEIQILREERIKLQTEQTPLGKERAVLLDAREKVLRLCLRKNNGLAAKRTYLRSADIKGIR